MKSNSMKVKNIIKKQLFEASPISFKEFPDDKKKNSQLRSQRV